MECSEYPENARAEVLQVVDMSDMQLGPRLKLKDTARLHSAFYGDCSDHDVKIAISNLVPVTPASPSMCRSDVSAGNFGSLPRGYIECTEDNAVPLALQRRFQKDIPGAKVRTLATSHSPFFQCRTNWQPPSSN